MRPEVWAGSGATWRERLGAATIGTDNITTFHNNHEWMSSFGTHHSRISRRRWSRHGDDNVLSNLQTLHIHVRSLVLFSIQYSSSTRTYTRKSTSTPKPKMQNSESYIPQTSPFNIQSPTPAYFALAYPYPYSLHTPNLLRLPRLIFQLCMHRFYLFLNAFDRFEVFDCFYF